MLAIALLEAACTTPAAVDGPHVVPAAQWTTPAADAATSPTTAAWWQDFGSTELDRLVDQALLANRDLRIAAARVAQARAIAEGQQAQRRPQIDLAASAGHGRDNSALPKADHFVSAGFRAQWELDLLGDQRLAARTATLGADQADQAERAAAIAVAAEVATAYFEAGALTRRIALHQATESLLQRQTDVARRRFDAGQVTQPDVDRWQAEWRTEQASLVQLQGERQTRLRQLAVLVGAAQTLPEPAFAGLERVRASTPTVPLPAELLERRPDVQQQARAVDIAAAKVGLARRDLYPRLQLSWAERLERAKLAGADSAATTLILGYGVGLSLPLFDGGRIRANIAGKEAEAREAMGAYEKAMLVALADADVALTQQAASLQAVAAWERATETSRGAAHRTGRLFEAGLTDLNTALDAQRGALRAEDALLQARAAQWVAAVAVRRAFAGNVAP